MNSVTPYHNNEHYSIHDFSFENFKYIIKEHTEFPLEKLDHNDLFRYLCRYLGWRRKPRKDESHLKPNAKYIFVEKEYSSDSFLRDFRAYYFDCYKPLPKFSQRVHFFQDSEEVRELKDKTDLEKILSHHDPLPPKFWDKCYLGYVVLRPFSSTVFGVCLLRTYLPKSNTEKRRCYNSTHTLRFDVFGHTVRDFEALPFLNQDGAIGACATSAIWSSFFKLSKIFKTKFLAPHKITENAGLSIRVKSSPYPSKGLDGHQIVQTLSKNGLSFDYIEKAPGENSYHIPFFELKRVLYAYNKKLGIPALIAYDIPTQNTQHLVCLAGYRLVNEGDEQYVDPTKPSKRDFTPIRSAADNIMRLYVHNDIFGPFAKVDFYENQIESPAGSIENESYMKSFQIVEDSDDLPSDSSTNCVEQRMCLETHPVQVFVPIAPNIRIRYKSIFRSAQAFEMILKLVMLDVKSLDFDSDQVVWDIYLDFGVGFKNDRLKPSFNGGGSKSISKEMKHTIASKALPRFIWIASMSIGGVTFMDIIYDPTTLPEEFCVKEIYIYDENIQKAMAKNGKDVIIDMINGSDAIEILTSNHAKFLNLLKCIGADHKFSDEVIPETNWDQIC